MADGRPDGGAPTAPWWLLAGPCLLAIALLWVVQGWFDVLLSLSPIAWAFATRSLQPAQRRRVLLFELPVILLAGLVIALLLAGGKARQLDADVPLRAAAAFGLYVGAWILALRLLYQWLGALARRLLRNRSLAAFAAGALIVALGMPQLFVALQTHRIPIGQPLPNAAAIAAAREVAFDTRDGLTLRGTLLSLPEWSEAHPVVIVCHGVGANRANVSGYVAVAQALGCHVLAFDMRGHGFSGGTASTMGAREADDVVDAVRFLRAEGFATHPVVLLGVSMGGAAVLRAAAEAGAAAVFAESAYADLGVMVGERVAALGPLRPFARWLVGVGAWLQLGIDVERVSPRASLAGLPAGVPVVLVHAGADRVIPLSQGRALAAARPGLALEVVDRAGHGACSYLAPVRVQELLRGLVQRVR